MKSPLARRPRHTISSLSRALAKSVAVLAGLLSADAARADTFYWDTTTTESWQTPSNWTTDPTGSTVVGSAVPGAGDTVYFNGSAVTGPTTVTLAGATAAAGINFQNTSTTALQSATAAQTLTVGTGGITVLAGAGAVTIGSGTAANAVNLALAGTQTWTNNSANVLTVVNALDLGANPLTLTGAGGTAVAGIVSGTGGLNVTGGTATLSGANTFTGDVTLSGGAIAFGNVQGLGKSTGTAAYKTLTITNNAVFRPTVTFNDNTPATTNQSALVFNIGTGGATFDVGTGLTLTIDDGTTADATATGAQLQGTGDLTKTGTGTLSLGNGTSNFATFSGQIFVNAGTLTTGAVSTNPFGTTAAGTTIASGAVLDVKGVNIGAEPLTISGTGLTGSPAGVLISSTGTGGAASGPITLAGNSDIGGAGTLTLSGAIGDNGSAYGINKVGAGTLTLSGTNTYTGGSAVTAGTLTATNPGTTNVIAALGTGSVALNAGTLAYRANGGGSFQTIATGNSITVGGAAAIDVNRVGANAGNGIAINNLSLGGFQLNVTGGNSYALNVAGTTTVTATGAAVNATTAPLNLLGQAVDGGNGLALVGTGVTRLLNTAAGAGANALTGTITVNSSALQAFAPAAGAAGGGSNSLGAAAVTLTGAAPTLYLAPSLSGGLTAAATAGLVVKTYSGLTTLAATNFLGTATTTGTAATINLPSVAGGASTTTSQQFTGLLAITTAGVYGFSAGTDDVGVTYIDGNPAINTNVTTVAGSYYLSAGLHAVSLRFNNNGGGGYATLNYQGPDTGGTLSTTGIPAAALSNATAAQLATTFNNAFTVATGTNATIQAASNTTLSGGVTFAGTGSTLTVAGTADVTAVALGSVTLSSFATSTATLAPTTVVLSVGSVTGTATTGNTNTLVLGGTSAPSAANGVNVVTGVISDGAGGGNVGVTHNTVGPWTIGGSASNTYTGPTTVVTNTLAGALTLAKTGGAVAVSGPLIIGNGTATQAFVLLGGNEQISATSPVTFTGINSGWGYLLLQGRTQTIGNVAETNAGFGIFETRETAGTFGTSTVNFNVASGTQTFQGYFRDIQTGLDAANSLTLVKSGAGTLQFGAASNGTGSAGTGTTTHYYSGGTTILNGTLQLLASGTSSPISLVGAGNVRLDGGAVAGTLDLNGLTTGITGLDGTTGAVLGTVTNSSTIAAVLSVGNNGNSGFYSGRIVDGTGTVALTKTGAGVQILTAPDAYSGATTISAGVLQYSNFGAVSATSAITVASGATLGVNVGGAGEFTNAASGNGSLGSVFAGAIGSGTATFTAGSAVGVDTSSGNVTYAGNIAGATVGLRKLGANTLTLTGNNAYVGPTTVTGGTLVAAGGSTGAGFLVVGSAAGNTVLSVVSGGTMSGTRLAVGNATGSAGAVYVAPGGTLTLTQGETTDTDTAFGAANGSYGGLLMTGGTYTESRLQFGGVGGTTGTAVGVGLVSGGTVNTNGFLIVSRKGTSIGALTVTGGTINHSGASQNIFVGIEGAGRAELNVAGGLINNTGRTVTFSGSSFSWTGTGVLNLNAGTLLTNGIAYGSGTAYANFNGGVLQAAASSTTFATAITTGGAYVNGAFGSYAGGAVVDTNGFNITVATNLLAPTGSGVTGIALTNGGSGYIGAPYVQISGGGGTGATGYATVDPVTGQVTGVVVTNPGIGYTSAPTVTFVGGGGTGATVGTPALAANTSGGLTKAGAGTLTLTGANTYTGPTTVNAGTLLLAGSSASTFTATGGGSVGVAAGGVYGAAAFANGGRYVLVGGGGTLTFDPATGLNGVTAVLHGSAAGTVAVTAATAGLNVDFSAAGANLSTAALGAVGAVTYTGTYTPAAGGYRLGGGGGTLALATANQLTGANAAVFGGANFTGTVALTAANNYTGGTTVTGPTTAVVNFSAANNFGTGPVAFTGGTFQFGNATADISTLTTTFASGTATFDTNGFSPTLANPVGNSGAGAFTKVGAGTLTVNGGITSTGALTVSAGTLVLNAATGVTGATTVAAGSSLVLGNANALRGSVVTSSTGLSFAGGVGTFTIGGLTGSAAITLADAAAAPITLQVGLNPTAQTYTGVLSGAGGLTKLGLNAQTLAAANLYTGTTSIVNGLVANGGASWSQLNLDFSNAAAPAANIVSASSPLSFGGSAATPGVAAVVVGGGELNVVGKASTTNSQTFNNTTIGVGSSNVTLAANATANPLALNLGAITRTAGGAIDFALPATSSATNGVLTTSGIASTILTDANGTAYATVGVRNVPNDWAAKDPTNTFILSAATAGTGGASLYTASTAAALTAGANINVVTSTTLANATTLSVNTLRFNDGTARTLALGTGSVLTVSTGGILFGTAAATGTTISGGTLRSGTQEMVIFSNATTTTVSSVIADSALGATDLTLTGSSPQIGATKADIRLGASNTYTGRTFIQGTRVQMLNVNTTPFSTGDVYIEGNAGGQFLKAVAGTVGNHFYIVGNGWAETNGPYGALRVENATLSGNITLLGDAAIGSVNTGAGTFAGNIDGTGFALTKLGGQVTILSGTNTYTGGTVVSAGAVQFNSAASLPTAGRVTVAAAGAVVFNYSTGAAGTFQTFLGTTLAPASAGVLALTTAQAGENIDLSGTGLNLPALQLGANTGTVAYTGTLTPNANTYRFGGTFGTLALNTANQLTGANGLVSTGNLTIGNTNNLTGSASVTAGTLTAANGGLGVANPVAVSGGTLNYTLAGTADDLTGRLTLSGGTLALTNAGAVTLAGSFGSSSTAAFTKAGAGALTVNQPTTFTGTTTVNGGNLVLGVTNALGVANQAAGAPGSAVVLNVAAGGATLTLNANQLIGSLANTGTLVATNGRVVLNGFTLTTGLNNAGTNFYSGISGTGGVTKVGTGTQIFVSPTSDPISYTGATTILGGAINLNFSDGVARATNILQDNGTAAGSTTLVLAGGTLSATGKASTVNSQTFTNGVTLNSGASGLTATNAASGTLLLALNAITRTTGGTVNFTNPALALSATNGITTTTANTGTTILGGWATVGNNQFAVSAGNGTTAGLITGLATGGGSFAGGGDVDAPIGASTASAPINSLRFNTAGAATVDAAAGLTVATGGVLVTSTVGTAAVTFNNGTITAGGPELFLMVNNPQANGLVVNSKVTGTIAVTKTGVGDLTLANATNDFTGTLTVSGGRVVLAAGVTLANAIVLNQGVGVSGVGAITTSGTTTLTGPIAVNASTLAGNTFSNTGGSLTISGFITAPNPGVIVGARVGTVTFSGGGNYGQFQNSQDTTRIGANDGLSTVAVADIAVSGTGTLDLAGFNQTLAGLKRTGASTTTVTNTGATTSTLTLNVGAGESYTYGGTLSGAVNLVKNGAGAETFSGTANTFAGTVTLNAGTLTLASAPNVTGTLTVAGGTLNLNTPTVASATVVSGGVVVLGNALSLGGTGAPLTMTGGTIDINGQGGLTVGTLSGTAGTITDNAATAGGAAVSAASSANTTFGGTLADGAVRKLSFTKDGTGTLTLTGSNAYSGLTYVTAGTLAANNAAGSATGSGAVTVAGGATLRGGNTAATAGFLAGPVTVTGGGVVRGGSVVGDTGTLTVANSVTLNSTAGSPNINAVLRAEVVATGANAANASRITLTGATSVLNLGGGTGAGGTGGTGTFTIDLVNASSLNASNTYVVTLASVSTGGNIYLNGVSQPAATHFTAFNGTTGSYTLTSSDSSINLSQFTSSLDVVSAGVGLGDRLQLSVAAAPEPTTVLGLAAGAFGLVNFVRRRRAAKAAR